MKRILLVDDSRAVRLAAGRMVRQLGFDVLEAEDGQDALRVVREQGPVDAVLLDWNMPVMDGLTFLKTLRSDASLPQPKVVMCTTENDMQRIIEAIQAGANEYIMKPFTEEIVKDKLQEAGLL
jgi:two-component system, chemotaxis family, chemotaxis protein CheY